MKKFILCAGLLTALVFTGSAQANPPSYPLLCRGGPAMRIATNHDVNGAGIPGATAMWVYFNKGSAAGSVHAPGPGECTWMDRTLNANEPAAMFIKSPNVEFSCQVMGDGQIARDGSGIRLNVEGANWSAEARSWDTIVKGVMNHGLFTVQVYNTGGASPVMMITHVGP